MKKLVFRRKAAKESIAVLPEAEHARLAKESGTVEFSGSPSDALSKPGEADDDGFAFGPCPPGKLTIKQKPRTICPGFKPQCGTIELFYNIPSGAQSHVHPNPGQPFTGAQRIGYLPDNVEGRKLLSRYQLCWLRGESLEIGYSVKLQRDNQVKWRDRVPHKTSLDSGGAFGWPDPGFLDEANQALDSLGIPNCDECLELLPHSKLFKKLVERDAAAFEAAVGNSRTSGISSARKLPPDRQSMKLPSAPSSPFSVVDNGPYPYTVTNDALTDSSSRGHRRHSSDPQMAFADQQHYSNRPHATHRRTQSAQYAQNPQNAHRRHFSDPQVAFAGQQQQQQQQSNRPHATHRRTHSAQYAQHSHRRHFSDPQGAFAGRRTQSAQHLPNAVLGWSSLPSQLGALDLFCDMAPTYKGQCDVHPLERRTWKLPPSTGSPLLCTPMVPMGSTTRETVTVEASAVPMATSVIHVQDAPAMGDGIFLVKFKRKGGDTFGATQSLPSAGGGDTLEAMRARLDNAAGMSPFHVTPEEAEAVEKKEKYFEVTFSAEGHASPIVGEWHVWQHFSVGEVAALVCPGGASKKNVTIQVELRDGASGRNP